METVGSFWLGLLYVIKKRKPEKAWFIGALKAGLMQVCMQETGVLGLKVIRAHVEGGRHLYRCLSTQQPGSESDA